MKIVFLFTGSNISKWLPEKFNMQCALFSTFFFSFLFIFLLSDDNMCEIHSFIRRARVYTICAIPLPHRTVHTAICNSIISFLLFFSLIMKVFTDFNHKYFGAFCSYRPFYLFFKFSVSLSFVLCVFQFGFGLFLVCLMPNG